MNCLACAGACCETFALPVSDILPPGSDEWRWIKLHAREHVDVDDREMLEFDVPCSKLTPAGRCGIYDDRPLMCRTYPAGGADCFDAVRRRRTPEQYQLIRDPQDPERIHP